MRFTKIRLETLPTVCAIMMLMPAVIVSQPASGFKTDTAKSAGHAKQLKPQTTCPVTGDAIDKNLFIEYNGKRIYVCCESCLVEVKKNPEKYINELESIGQSVETIGSIKKQAGNDAKADTAIKGMDMKDMRMSADVSAKAMDTGYWTCTMHPEIHQTAPGNCPICGMRLVFKKSDKETREMKTTDNRKMKK